MNGPEPHGPAGKIDEPSFERLTAIISKTETTVIFLNKQAKIGVVFGSETTTGGMALKFYASVRIELRRAAQIKMGENFIGNRVKAKIVKIVAPPLRPVSLILCIMKGFLY